jgi:UDP-glucose 4-epimerase
LRAGGASGFVNPGDGQGYSVPEVMETAKRVTGREVEYSVEPPRPGDPTRLVADAEKARALSGWQPAYTDLSSLIRTDRGWRTVHPGDDIDRAAGQTGG